MLDPAELQEFFGLMKRLDVFYHLRERRDQGYLTDYENLWERFVELHQKLSSEVGTKQIVP